MTNTSTHHRSTRALSLSALCLAIAAMMLATLATLGAQAPAPPLPAPAAPQTQQAPRKNPIPETFTNLKVLPTDIKKADLVNIMKALSVGMKVRCTQCHVANDDLSEANFASDDKPAKVASREMLKTLFDTRAKYPAASTTAAADSGKK